MNLKRNLAASGLCLVSFVTVSYAQLLQPNANAVVAVVDGKPLTRTDIDKIQQSAPPEWLQTYKVNPQSALGLWFFVQHLGKLGEDKKLADASPLKEQVEALRLQMMAQAMVGYEENSYPVTNEMIDAYFEKHRAEYSQSHIKAIYISFKPQLTATGTSATDLEALAKTALAGTNATRSEADAKIQATDIVKQLRNGGDFSKLVQQYSDDASSKANDGDFGIVKPTSPLPEDLRAAVLAQAEGTVSDPIRQPAGFYVIRVEEKSARPVNDVSSDIVKTIRGDHTKQWLLDLQKRFTPEIKDQTYFAAPGLQGFEQTVKQSIGQPIK